MHRHAEPESLRIYYYVLHVVNVDFPEPDNPKKDATNFSPLSNLNSFCPPWQEAYPLRFAIAMQLLMYLSYVLQSISYQRSAAQFVSVLKYVNPKGCSSCVHCGSEKYRYLSHLQLAVNSYTFRCIQDSYTGNLTSRNIKYFLHLLELKDVLLP